MQPFLLAIASTVAVLQAQDVRPLAGRVLATNGDPIVGATVHLLHRPVPICVDIPGEHRVTATTGENGVFRATVRGDARYSLWASWADGATAIVEGAEAGSFVELVQDPYARARRVRLVGVEPWADRGPFVCRVLVGTENADFVEVVPEDSVISIPPLPWVGYHRMIEVVTADGDVLWADTAKRSGDGEELPVPPPYPLTVDVRAAEDGEPVAGAEVRVRIRNYWVTYGATVPFGERFRILWGRVGATDANGRLTAQVPVERSAGGEPGRLLLSVQAEGRHGALGGLHDGGRIEKGSVAPSARKGPFEFVLARSEATPLPLSIDGRALPDGLARVVWRVTYRISDTSASGLPLARVLPIRDGALQLPSPLALHCELESLVATLGEPLRTAFATDRAGPAPTAIRMPVAGAYVTGTPVTLQAVTPDGRPAERTAVFVLKRESRHSLRELVSQRTDRLGRVTVDLAEDAHVVILGREGHAVVPVSPEAKAGVVHVDLEPHTHALLRVVARGEPCVGVRVIPGAFEPLPDADEDTTLLAQVIGRALPEIAFTVTDAEGRARVPLPCGGTLWIQVCDSDGDMLSRQQVPVPDNGAEVVVELDERLK